jgi:hypothetical protein
MSWEDATHIVSAHFAAIVKSSSTPKHLTVFSLGNIQLRENVHVCSLKHTPYGRGSCLRFQFSIFGIIRLMVTEQDLIFLISPSKGLKISAEFLRGISFPCNDVSVISRYRSFHGMASFSSTLELKDRNVRLNLTNPSPWRGLPNPLSTQLIQLQNGKSANSC